MLQRQIYPCYIFDQSLWMSHTYSKKNVASVNSSCSGSPFKCARPNVFGGVVVVVCWRNGAMPIDNFLLKSFRDKAFLCTLAKMFMVAFVKTFVD
jgi:hypothetical protein